MMTACLDDDIGAWLGRLNLDRGRAGLGPVTISATLMDCALDYATLMAERDHFSHTGPDGSSPRARMTAAGYPAGTYGEIILYGEPTWEAVYQGWKDSPPHWDVMLTDGLTEVGIAFGVEPEWSYAGDVYLAACAVFGGAHTAQARRCELRERPPERVPRPGRESCAHLPNERPPKEVRREERKEARRLVRRWLRKLGLLG